LLLDRLRKFVIATSVLSLSAFADEQPKFFYGLNLNGPPVVIDGNAWEGKESQSYECDDKPFENQHVKLVPATDDERAKMIRSSQYGGNRVELKDVPPGTYTVFLYVWEDNNAENFSLSVNGTKVLDHNSGATGHWDKLGPWPVVVKKDAKIVLTSKGGAANFSGIEVWQGIYDGSAKKSLRSLKNTSAPCWSTSAMSVIAPIQRRCTANYWSIHERRCGVAD
jgi:hypothetical protein